MRITDTSAALRTSSMFSRPSNSPANEPLQRGESLSQFPRSPIAADGSGARGLASTLSEMHLNAAEPSPAEKAKASAKAAEAEFGKWANMSPAEKIRASILERHRLTEDSLKGLPEEKRDSIEKEIAEAIKRSYGLEDPGSEGAAQADASAAPKD